MTNKTRDFIFKAKAAEEDEYCNIKKGQWVCGSLMYDAIEDDYIIFDTTKEYIAGIKVDPKTISEFTGKRDFKQRGNGKMIFENDILLFVDNGKFYYVYVKYDDGAFRLFENFKQKYSLELLNEENINFLNLKVVGNIFDDKELAKEFL